MLLRQQQVVYQTSYVNNYFYGPVIDDYLDKDVDIRYHLHGNGHGDHIFMRDNHKEEYKYYFKRYIQGKMIILLHDKIKERYYLNSLVATNKGFVY